MPEIKIKIDSTVHEKLKNFAKEDDRSLTKYIERGLKYLASIPNGYHNISNDNNNTSSLVPTEINGRKIKSITYEKTLSTTTPTTATTTTPPTHTLNTDKLYTYFKKKFKEVWSSYMPSPQTLPPCFTSSSLDYIFIKHPDQRSIDSFIDNELDHVDFNDPTYEFYLYQSIIEEREKKLIIPLSQNHIYSIIKNYCLENDLSDVLYTMMEYPNPLFENLLFDTELNNSPSFLYNILDDSVTEQQIVDALTWQDDDY